MKAYDHEDIISTDGEESKVELHFKCKEIGGKEYIVHVWATVYLEYEGDGGDRWTAPICVTYVKEVEITSVTISDIEDRSIAQFNTTITDEFLIDQIESHCIES